MPYTVDRVHTPTVAPTEGGGRRRPIVLATLSVRVDPGAERMALDSAQETGAQLIVANMLMVGAYPMTLTWAPEFLTLPEEEDLDAVRATADRAAERGIRTELLRISSVRPVRTLLELLHERDAALVVFGPDLRRTSRLRFRAAARLVRRNAPCLVWIAPDG
ncbi:MAG: universal stress protein [Solirubrobacteraceae bacterium]